MGGCLRHRRGWNSPRQGRRNGPVHDRGRVTAFGDGRALRGRPRLSNGPRGSADGMMRLVHVDPASPAVSARRRCTAVASGPSLTIVPEFPGQRPFAGDLVDRLRLRAACVSAAEGSGHAAAGFLLRHRRCPPACAAARRRASPARATPGAPRSTTTATALPEGQDGQSFA